MSLVIRKMGPNDARAILEVHHAAVRGIAAKDYPTAVVDGWAQLPITENAIERVRANPDNEYRLVAEINGRVVGIGVLVVKNSVLRDCYVAPGRTAREWAQRGGRNGAGCPRTQTSVSGIGLVNYAEPFYAALGYEVCERGQHILGSGQPMACVKVRKELAS